MLASISIGAIVVLMIKQAPAWLEVMRETIFDKGKEIAAERGKEVAVGKLRKMLHLDEKEQRRHLELALKNALERGLAVYHTAEERDQYRLLHRFGEG